MNLDELAEKLRAQIKEHGKIIFDKHYDGFISGKQLEELKRSFNLKEDLSITHLKETDVGVPKDNKLEVSNGYMHVLSKEKVHSKIIFSMDNGNSAELKLIIVGDFGHWNFIDSFKNLNIFPFNKIKPHNTSFIYSSDAVSEFPVRAGDKETQIEEIPLQPGLNMASELEFDMDFDASYSIINGVLLGATKSFFFGTIVPDSRWPYPTMKLKSLWKGLSNLEIVKNSVEAINAGLALDISEPEGQIQEISLNFSADLAKKLHVAFEILGKNKPINITLQGNRINYAELKNILPDLPQEEKIKELATNTLPASAASGFAKLTVRSGQLILAPGSKALRRLTVEIGNYDDTSWKLGEQFELQRLSFAFDLVRIERDLYSQKAIEQANQPPPAAVPSTPESAESAEKKENEKLQVPASSSEVTKNNEQSESTGTNEQPTKPAEDSSFPKESVQLIDAPAWSTDMSYLSTLSFNAVGKILTKYFPGEFHFYAAIKVRKYIFELFELSGFYIGKRKLTDLKELISSDTPLPDDMTGFSADIIEFSLIDQVLLPKVSDSPEKEKELIGSDLEKSSPGAAGQENRETRLACKIHLQITTTLPSEWLGLATFRAVIIVIPAKMTDFSGSLQVTGMIAIGNRNFNLALDLSTIGQKKGNSITASYIAGKEDGIFTIKRFLLSLFKKPHVDDNENKFLKIVKSIPDTFNFSISKVDIFWNFDLGNIYISFQSKASLIAVAVLVNNKLAENPPDVGEADKVPLPPAVAVEQLVADDPSTSTQPSTQSEAGWHIYLGINFDREFALGDLPLLKDYETTKNIKFYKIRIFKAFSFLDKKLVERVNGLIKDKAGVSIDKYPIIPNVNIQKTFPSGLYVAVRYSIGGVLFDDGDAVVKMFDLPEEKSAVSTNEAAAKGAVGGAAGKPAEEKASAQRFGLNMAAAAPMQTITTAGTGTGTRTGTRPASRAISTADNQKTSESNALQKQREGWWKIDRLGPLNNVVLDFKLTAKKITILIDFSFSLDMFSLDVIGLGFGLEVPDWKKNVGLEGLNIEIDFGAGKAGGGLVTSSFVPLDANGQLYLKMPLWGIKGIASLKSENNFYSLMCYFVGDLPPTTPPISFSGFSIGAGWNRALLVPDVSEISDFPLVKWAKDDSSAGAPNPRSRLEQLRSSAAIAPRKSSYWFAGGAKFTINGIVHGVALITVKYEKEAQFNVIGLAEIQVPASSVLDKASALIMKEPPRLFFSDLQILATYRHSEGRLSIEAQLGKSSFFLSKQCFISGGVAIYIWLRGEHKGQFVISAGGYNSKYKVPSYYPYVPRIGIGWKLSDNCVLKGEAYVAITSAAVMMGFEGLLNIKVGKVGNVLEKANISISLKFDILLIYRPCFYQVDISTIVGLELNLQYGVFKLPLQGQFNAGIKVWGPEFSGIVTLPYFGSFPFGAARKKDRLTEPLLPWEVFLSSVLNVVPDDRVKDKMINLKDGFHLNAANGLIDQVERQEGPWDAKKIDFIISRGKLEFIIQTIIPLKESIFSSADISPSEQNKLIIFSGIVGLAKAEQQPARAPNPAFGVGPVGVSNSDFRPKFTLSIHSAASGSAHAPGDKSAESLQCIRILSNISAALWKESQFKDGYPVIGDPLNETVIENVLTGYRIVPVIEPLDIAFSSTLENLQNSASNAAANVEFGHAYLPATKKFPNETVEGSINQATAKNNRSFLLDAMHKAMRHYSSTAEFDTNIVSSRIQLFAEPTFQILGA